MKLTHRVFPLAAIVAATLSESLHAATAEMQAEYSQVRKIAMKDPGVRAAYAKADAKLNAKIIEIDPSLRPLVEHPNAAPAPATRRSAQKQPVRTASTSASYVVAKGDTLTSIAARYQMTAADLKSANGIVDERKLQVGQKLTIPARSTPTRAPAKTDAGLWTRLKGGM